MAFLMILLVYLSLPFIELGIIIVLAVSRNHYKRIAEQMEDHVPEPVRPPAVPAAVSQGITAGPETCAAPAVPVSQKPGKKAASSFQQGTVLLVIGVIFVILAGLIFATTTWSILPPVTKAVLVLMITALFFGASAAAERKFRIRKTGKAFYILGSIFVFVTTLAFGYFGLLGQEMTLTGENNRMLFFLGMFLTEIALFYGMKFFEDKIYTMVCLYGITVTVLFMISSWKLSDQMFTLGIAVYGGAAVLAEPLIRRTKGMRLNRIAAMYPFFAAPNLWIISVLVLVWTGFGFFSGLAALLVGAVHFYQGGSQGRWREPEACSSTAFLIVGIAKLLHLEQMNDYMYLMAVTMFLLTVLNTFEWFGPEMKTGFTVVHIIMAVMTLAMLLQNSVTNWELNLSAVICMGILLADVTVTAWREKNASLYAVHGVILVLFVHYAAYYPDVDIVNKMILVTVLMGVLFFSNWKGFNPLGSRIGDTVATAVIACNVLAFVLIRLIYGSSFWLGLWNFVTETGAVLILTLVLWGWDRWRKGISRSCPLVLALVLIPVRYVISYQWNMELAFQWLLFIYLILACLWDLLIRKKREIYQISITVAGFLFAVLGFRWTQGNLPYLLILAAYLMIKLRGMEEGGKRTAYIYTAFISGLLGLYLIGFDSSAHVLIQVLVPAAGLIGGDLVLGAVKPSGRYSRFFVIAGMCLYGAAVLGFAGDGELSLWYLGALAVLFVWHYQKSYRMENSYWHLAPSLMTLLLPWVVMRNYDVGKDVIYTAVMVGLVVTTALARKKIVLIEWSEKQVVRADWFHMFQITLILPMAVMAGTREWGFVYVLLMAGYALQYYTIPGWRRHAVTAAGVMGCVAFWIQPFITWPDILSLEIRLIPAAGFIWALSRLWGRRKAVWNLQTGLFLGCLALLSASAFQSQSIGDALMLEGICLTILITAYQKKCVRWVKLSGGLAMGVALYVTRGFWLNISWWLYLLAAGIGLILFAAANELKKR